MRIAKTAWILAITALIWAACGFACAEAEYIEPGELCLIELSDEAQDFEFTAQSGSVYDICVFPARDGDVGVSAQAKLTQGGRVIGTGSGRLALISHRLVSGEKYALSIKGSGYVYLEVARHALSRCFSDPVALNAGGDAYSKAIAKPGDVHWYSITATDNTPVLIAAVPDADGPRLEVHLFGESGTLLADATPTMGGTSLIDFPPRRDRTYRVRVRAVENDTGMYTIYVGRENGVMPKAATLERTSLTLSGRESVKLNVNISPEGAVTQTFWESSNPDVVTVDRNGVLTGRQTGTAMVTVYAAGGVSARCRVEVVYAPVTGVGLLTDRLWMHVGDDVALEWRVLPEHASSPRVKFETDRNDLLSIDRGGVVRALGEGEAIVTVRTEEGDFEASLNVTILPAQRRYRALLIGEQSYAKGVASVRRGSANSVAGMRSMLGQLSFGETRYEIATKLDVTRDGILRAIEDSFGEASDEDVSLFYITCHGYYSGGMTYFQMYDGSVLSAAELRDAFDRVKGGIVLLIDCCASGGAIGRAGAQEDVIFGVKAVFPGTVGPTQFGSSRFRVLASASIEQESYRLSFKEDTEVGMATLFARAVCEAGGWNIDESARSPMRADDNYDGVVSLDELHCYVSERVMWYLTLNAGSKYAQTVHVSPEGDIGSVFERATN